MRLYGVLEQRPGQGRRLSRALGERASWLWPKYHALVEWNPMVPELLVGDFETSRAFYVELLGFAVCFERTAPPFAYLDLDGAQLMIEQDHPEAWRTVDLEAPRGRGMNLQIEVEDAAGLRDRLKTAGHQPFRDLADAWYDIGGGSRSGLRQFLVQDPDGYLLRFAEPLGERSV